MPTRRCAACKKAEVPEGEGHVCNGCRPTIRRRSKPIEDTLAMIDTVLAGYNEPYPPGALDNRETRRRKERHG